VANYFKNIAKQKKSQSVVFSILIALIVVNPVELQRKIGHFNQSDEVLQFVNSNDLESSLPN